MNTTEFVFFVKCQGVNDACPSYDDEWQDVYDGCPSYDASPSYRVIFLTGPPLNQDSLEGEESDEEVSFAFTGWFFLLFRPKND